MTDYIKKLADRMTDYSDSDWAMNINHFDWVPGVGLFGIYNAYEETKDKKYLDFLISWADAHIDEAYDMQTVNSTAPLLTIKKLYDITGNEKYLKVCTDVAENLITTAPLTSYGGLEHTVTEEGADFHGQVWADTLFMAAFLMLRVGAKLRDLNMEDPKDQAISEYADQAADIIDDALNQYYWHIQYLQDQTTSLWFHGYNNINKDHMSGFYWGRANAWAAYTMSQVKHNLHDWYLYPQCMDIECSLRDQLAAIKLLQTENGLWRTILNDEESYEEVSASAGIAAAMVEMNNPLHTKYVQKALNGIMDNISPDGRVLNVSGGTAVMKDREGYRNVPKAWMQGWGQGLALAFLTAVLKQEKH